MQFRNNKQIWRLAQYMFDATIISGDWSFDEYRPWYRDLVYDRAAELLKKLHNNEFTGKDDHND